MVLALDAHAETRMSYTPGNDLRLASMSIPLWHLTGRLDQDLVPMG